jgi:hypothetical protein
MPSCPRCGKEVEPGQKFCRNCGLDAQTNTMMPLFVASRARRRLLGLAAAWLLPIGLLLLYTLDRNPVLEALALVAAVLTVAVWVFALRQREPYSYEFFESFVRVKYPSSFSRLATTRIPYSSIEGFVRVGEGAGTRYEFSIRGREDRYVVRGVTSYAGVDLSRWIQGKVSGPPARVT